MLDLYGNKICTYRSDFDTEGRCKIAVAPIVQRFILGCGVRLSKLQLFILICHIDLMRDFCIGG